MAEQPKQPLKNCGTCANFPCPAYLAQGRAAQSLSFGMGMYNFQTPSAVPMACGGVDWKEKVATARARREPEGAAFDQFKKKSR